MSSAPIRPRRKRLTLELTPLEARSLAALVSEGAQGLLNDELAAAAYIGNKRAQAAARSAMGKLNTAIYDAGLLPKASA